MALVKFGGGITEMRGSIGGSVFSRNRSGATVRARTTPVNPKTALQSAIRAIISFVSQSWRTATTAAQKAGWAVYAANVPAKNKLGEVISLSGFNQYVKSNVAAQNAGLTAILSAPSVFTLPGEDSTLAAVISEGSQEIAVTFDATREWVDEDNAGLLIYMGMPQDDSIEFFDGPWRYAGIISGDGTAPPVTGDAVAVPFPVVADQKVFVQARIIRADGRLSDTFRSSTIAGA
jgi:hypothetical protein